MKALIIISIIVGSIIVLLSGLVMWSCLVMASRTSREEEKRK